MGAGRGQESWSGLIFFIFFFFKPAISLPEPLKCWFFHWTTQDSPEVCTDIKQSFLLCRTSLQQIMELFQTGTLNDAICCWLSSQGVSGAFPYVHAQRRAASISHLRSSVFRVSRSRLRWTGLAPRDIDLLLICVGRNFARAAYALHIGCISILFRLSELFMITSRKIKRGYRDG